MPYSTLRQKQNQLIRKARDGSVFVGEYATTPAVTSLYAGATASEVQTVTVTGTPTGGTFTLSFNGATTAGIAYNAANTAVQSALQALSTIGSGNATVTGSGPYTVTFAGTLANQNVPLLTGSGAGLTGGTSPGVTVALTTQGVGTDLLYLPAGYTDLGHLSTDGVSFGRSTDISDVNSFGSVEPTRSDVTNDTITMQVTCQETKLQTISMYTGTTLSGVTSNATTGETKVQKPQRPGFQYYRVVALFVDDTEYGEVWMSRVMPRARITEYGEQTFTSGDDPVSYQLTLTGYEDATLGYSHMWLFAGPGWTAMRAAMGF